MDRIVELLVRIISAFAWCARILPNMPYETYEPGQKVKILLAGYNGARNTGSDVRVAALAAQIRNALGPDNVEISVMTLDAESTAPYFNGLARQIPFNTLFFVPLFKACSSHHLAILCEGSTFKSTFADALTLYSCEAAGVMRAQGKPCIAYGGEVGAMQPYLERAVRDLCAEVLFIARSGPSYEAARRLGLNALQGTDTAWTFDSSLGEANALSLLRQGGWDGAQPLLGIAPVNPYWWPVKPSLAKWAAAALGDERFLQFQKWYFFSWDEKRNALFQRYLDDLAAATMTFCRENGFMPVVIGMEKLDADACAQLAKKLGGEVPVVLSRDHDGFTIAALLRSLELLLTSRYHAQVLAAGANVPAVAVSIDERLDNLAGELAMPSQLLLHVGQPDLDARVLLALDYAFENRMALSATIAENRLRLEALLEQMSTWLQMKLPA